MLHVRLVSPSIMCQTHAGRESLVMCSMIKFDLIVSVLEAETACQKWGGGGGLGVHEDLKHTLVLNIVYI